MAHTAGSVQGLAQVVGGALQRVCVFRAAEPDPLVAIGLVHHDLIHDVRVVLAVVRAWQRS